MKSAFRVFLFAVVLVAVAHSYPGATRDSSDSSEEGQKNEGGVDTVLVLPGNRNPFSRSVFRDTDLDDDSLEGVLAPGFYRPFSINPFNGFLTSMQSVMNRLREQMASVLSRIPEEGFVSPWGKIPEGANTTSTTKVVDGHVITINETTYSNGNDSHGAVFRVRIIDVKPQNDTLETIGVEVEPELTTESEGTTRVSEDTTPAKSVETVEDLSDNEIPNAQVEILNA